MLPDVRAWTPAANTASSLESLRLISDDCAERSKLYLNLEIKKMSVVCYHVRYRHSITTLNLNQIQVTTNNNAAGSLPFFPSFINFR